jgi:hypothetical protein
MRQVSGAETFSEGEVKSSTQTLSRGNQLSGTPTWAECSITTASGMVDQH